MRIYLIRHGITKGNREHRYVGSTEEALLPEAEEALLSLKERLEKNVCRKRHLLVSPMLRCRQSAEILFPGEKQTVVKDFRECDFGEFEYKNYEELNGNTDYQRFLDSMGEAPFPGGESKKEFSERCSRAFEREIRRLLSEERNRKEELNLQEMQEAFLIVHGGTIMAILDRFSDPHRDYYDWQIRNGEGFQAETVEERSGTIRLKEIRSI